MNYWVFLAISGQRQYGGNIGYIDDPEAIYRYDSNVPNHKRVKQGDVVIVRDRNEILGVARIEEIYEQPGDKVLFRCPKCGTTKFTKRKAMLNPFRCRKGHLFDEPKEEIVSCLKFEARFGSSFMRPARKIEILELRGYFTNRGGQQAIRQVKSTVLARLGVENGIKSRPNTPSDGPRGHHLSLKDGSDVAAIRRQAEYTIVRLHNRMTNKFQTIAKTHRKIVYEGNSHEALFDCLIENYRGDGRYLLVEAKSGSDLASVRLAVGQLFDYQRYVRAPELTDKAVLLSEQPDVHVKSLLKSLGILVLYFTTPQLDMITGDANLEQLRWEFRNSR